jgi:hypothetical protein
VENCENVSIHLNWNNSTYILMFLMCVYVCNMYIVHHIAMDRIGLKQIVIVIFNTAKIYKCGNNNIKFSLSLNLYCILYILFTILLQNYWKLFGKLVKSCRKTRCWRKKNYKIIIWWFSSVCFVHWNKLNIWFEWFFQPFKMIFKWIIGVMKKFFLTYRHSINVNQLVDHILFSNLERKILKTVKV